jgi:hypothetical protein
LFPAVSGVMQYMCAGLVYIYIHKTAAEREREWKLKAFLTYFLMRQQHFSLSLSACDPPSYIYTHTLLDILLFYLFIRDKSNL